MSRRTQRLYLLLTLALSGVASHTHAESLPNTASLSSVGSTIPGVQFIGADAGDFSGWDIRDAGDVNGDGIDDFLVSALLGDPLFVNEAGEVYLIYGQSGGSVLTGTLDISNVGGSIAGAVFQGVGANEQVGKFVACGGDVNGDGLDDVLIGSDDVGSGDKVYLVYGRRFDNSPLSGDIYLWNVGGSVDGVVINGFSLSVSIPGDFNGDGFAEILVGGSSNTSYMIWGGNSLASTITLTNVGQPGGVLGIVFSGFGHSFVGSAGDFNGDSLDDILIVNSGISLSGGFGARSYKGGISSTVVYGVAGDPTLNSGLVDFASYTNKVTFQQSYDSGPAPLQITTSAAGDFNGDGIDDLFIATSFALVYGQSGASQLTGTYDVVNAIGNEVDGFQITGFPLPGVSVDGAGDINGDGYDDVIIGESFADPNNVTNAGRAVLLYGFPETPPRLLNASDFGEGIGSVILNGVAASDFSGFSVSGGFDLNNDGFSDFAISAHMADPNGKASAGTTYVIYGASAPTPDTAIGVESLFHAGGRLPRVTFNGIAAGDKAGIDVSNAGDFNGDGVDDILINASGADQFYVIYGEVGFTSMSGTKQLSDLGSSLAGVTFNGTYTSVNRAGDFNGDGVDDLVVGHTLTSVSGPETGSIGVIYGQSGGAALSGAVNLSDVSISVAGVAFLGIDPFDHAGDAVAGAGDFNGDGVDDLMIAAPDADPNGNSIAGETYIVYGQTGASELNGLINLSTLGGTLAGATFNGIVANDGKDGLTLSNAGDFNGDGVGDMVIGARGVLSRTGEVYLVYGRGGGTPYSGSYNLSDLGGAVDGIQFTGRTTNDYLGITVTSAGDVNGDGLTDVAFGAPGPGTSAGMTYLVYGQAGASELSGTISVNDIGFTSASGSPTGAVIHGTAANDDAGRDISGLGDFNGDGLDDLIIGAPEATEFGDIFVLYGRSGISTTRGSFLLSSLGVDRYQGPHSGDKVGFSVSGAGDFNGDGVNDLLVGAWGADPNGVDSGQVLVLYGQWTAAPKNPAPPTSGNITTQLTLDATSSGGATFSGTSIDDNSGYSVSNVGDFNGDGIDDLIIGAPSSDPGGTSAAGTVYLVYGQLAGENLTGAMDLDSVGTSVAGFTLKGLTGGDKLGISVSSAGDFNGDGVADLIVGAYAISTGRPGLCYVIYGQTGGSALSGEIDVSQIGSTVAGAVFNGIEDGGIGNRTGAAVSSAGDINADGVDDILIGAPLAVSAIGEVYLVYGQTGAFELSGTFELSNLGGTLGGAIFQGAVGNDRMGSALSGAGDFNNDGIDDFIIGVNDHNIGIQANAGQAYLIYGKSGASALSGTLNVSNVGGTIHGVTFNGTENEDRAGYAVSNAGDINGDGIADILITAPDVWNNNQPGQVYLIYGQSGASELTGTLELSAVGSLVDGAVFLGIAGDHAGYAVSGGGDLNNDGIDDLIIGEPADANSSSPYGMVYAVYGQSSSPLSGVIDLSDIGDTLDGELLFTGEWKDRIGYTLSITGDYNGDGEVDLLIGAWGADPNGIEDAGTTYLVYGVRIDFASPLFTTHSQFDANHTAKDVTWVHLHNNAATAATAIFTFRPLWGDPAVTFVTASVALAAGETTLIDLEADLGVERERWGAYTLEIIGVDTSAITVDEVVDKVSGPNDGAYVPVRPLAAQSVGTYYHTLFMSETYLQLFNASTTKMAIEIDFYEAGSASVISTYSVTVPPQAVEIVTLRSDMIGNGTFVPGRPMSQRGHFQIRVNGSTPPPELVANTHITIDGAQDILIGEVQNPDSGSGLVSPYFQVSRNGNGTSRVNTFLALVNTGPSNVTAQFSFSNGVTGSVSDRILEPNVMQYFVLSDPGQSDGFPLGLGAVEEGGYKISFTGADTTKVSAVQYLIVDQQPGTDTVHMPVRAPATENIGTFYQTGGTDETFLFLYNTFSVPVTATVTFTRLSDSLQEVVPVVLSANDAALISVSTVQSLTTGTGWFAIDYAGASGLGSVQTSAAYRIGTDFRWIDLQTATGP